MFPLTVIQYVKVAGCVAVLGFCWYLGFSFSNSRFLEYKARQAALTAQVEKDQQAQADQIRKQKDDQINAINNQLADALISLHNRPSRAQQAGNGQSGTGAALFAEDAEFLVREAARADQIRVGLESCYKQYDSLK